MAESDRGDSPLPAAPPPQSYLVTRCSGLSGFPDCGRRWAANTLWREIATAGYVLRESSRGIGAAVGTSVHKSAQADLEAKAKTGALPPLDLVTDCAVEQLREEVRLGIDYDQRVTPTRNDAEQQVLRMAKSYHHEVAPGLNPVLVERRLDALIPWSTQNIVLSGQPDIVAREPDALDDLKTGTRRGYFMPQMGAYSLIVRSHGLAEVTQSRLTWVPRTAMKKPQPPPFHEPIDIVRAESTAISIIKAIDTAVRTWREGDPERDIKPGDPAAFIANPSSMLCSPKYCRAHSCGVNGWCREHDPAPDHASTG